MTGDLLQRYISIFRMDFNARQACWCPSQAAQPSLSGELSPLCGAPCQQPPINEAFGDYGGSRIPRFNTVLKQNSVMGVSSQGSCVLGCQ